MKTKFKKQMIQELDSVTRLEVFERDSWTCLRCGSTKNLQWAHVLSRRHMALRWTLENGMTLCAGCHLKWHHEPLMAIDWFRKNFSERYELLTNAFMIGEAGRYHTRNGRQKVDVQAIWEEKCGTTQ